MPAAPRLSVVPDDANVPTIRVEMCVEMADQLAALLQREHHTEEDSFRESLVEALLFAAHEATSFAAPLTFEGCPGLWPDAKRLPLDEPALLRGETAQNITILIPAVTNALDAITTAISFAKEVDPSLDTTDLTLMAEVRPARWLVLNECESTEHDFHPELAMLGPATEGAVFVTRVDIFHATDAQ
jgi:hypothetical protein